MCDDPACNARVARLEKENRELRKRLEAIEHRLDVRELPTFVKESTKPVEAKPSGRPEAHEGIGRKTPDEIHERKKLEAVSVCPDCSKTREFAEKRLQAILSKDYQDANCKRLVKRLLRHEKELFTFCSYRGAEDQNNHAERGIRPAVVIRKTSFGSQSGHGAQDTAVLMSFFQTARLQNENFLEYMQNLTENRLQN
ncbi:transposase [Candidatus Micrarchaeota archaeon]|nr:transposase [Candidatus Micrarchaeota archaeon]